MRDAQAFEIELRIEDEIFGKIGGEQLVVLGFEDFECERLAGFFDRMNDFFELGEHRLPEKTAADIIDLPIDDVGAHLGIVRLLEQVVGEQLFVKGRRDLGRKNWVLVILKHLRVLREPAVHRVPGFVGESVNIGKHVVLVVHQDVWRRAVAAGGKPAAAFRFGFVAIAPAAMQTRGQNIDIFLPQRSERAEHHLDRLIKGDARLNFRDERDIGVVMMQLGQTEHATAQFKIAEKRREMRAHRFDQPFVNGDRHIIGEKRGLKRGGKIAGARPENICLYRIGQ